MQDGEATFDEYPVWSWRTRYIYVFMYYCVLLNVLMGRLFSFTNRE